jgi:hypothetical protein
MRNEAPFHERKLPTGSFGTAFIKPSPRFAFQMLDYSLFNRANGDGGPREISSAPYLRGSLCWFPALWQHIESQRVTVGILIAFPHCYWRQHVPDTVIIEDVTLAAFAHREAIHLVFVIVRYDDFATASAAAAQ